MRKRIALDSMVFIYFESANPSYGNRTREIFARAESGLCDLVASTIVLTEVLTGYRQSRQSRLEAEFWAFLQASSPFLKFISVSTQIADEAARIRAAYKLKTPDALHLATAIRAEADLFVTNDRKLKVFTEVPILLLS